MTKFDDKEIYVEYKDFFVTDAADLYRLHLGQPSGNAGDCVFLTSLTITFNAGGNMSAKRSLLASWGQSVSHSPCFMVITC